MRNPLSKKVETIQPSGIRKFFDIVSEMEDVISLGVGEPDFDTPWHIRDEGIYTLEKGRTFYTSNSGLKELRVAIAEYLRRRFEVSYDPLHEILVTVGGSEGIDVALRAMLDPGDEVLIPEPCYVSYVPCVVLADGVPVTIELKEENQFRLTKEELLAAITDKTKILVMPFPNNPTGGVMRREDLEEITGWRLGYICGPQVIVEQMTKIHQFAIMCAPTNSQYAAVEALRHGDADVAQMRTAYDQRRRYLMHAFKEMGLSCFEPFGAFYVFPCIKEFGMSSDEFATRLLEEEHVAVVPGSAFGACGEGFVRISYAYSLENLKLAMERLSRFVGHLREWQKK